MAEPQARPTSNLLMNLLATVTTVCALTVTALLVRREISPSAPPLPAPQIIADWQRFSRAGNRMGPANAPVVLVEFSDFQCPACRELSRSLAGVRARYPDQFAIVFRQFPLGTIHPVARAVSIASECAGAQGRFEAFHARAFGAQDSLLTFSLVRMAAEVGVADTSAFKRCMVSPEVVARLKEDSLAAASLGIQGTPLFLLNEKRLSGAAPEAALVQLVKDALDSRPQGSSGN